MGFERIASEAIWQGHIGGVRVDTFRYDDGSEATREIVSHPGAVTVLPFDGEHIWLVRQPREPVGEQALLELPAGKIERPSKGGTAPLCNPPSGEDLEATARRELAEEIGKGANDWRHLVSFYNSPGQQAGRVVEAHQVAPVVGPLADLLRQLTPGGGLEVLAARGVAKGGGAPL